MHNAIRQHWQRDSRAAGQQGVAMPAPVWVGVALTAALTVQHVCTLRIRPVCTQWTLDLPNFQNQRKLHFLLHVLTVVYSFLSLALLSLWFSPPAEAWQTFVVACGIQRKQVRKYFLWLTGRYPAVVCEFKCFLLQGIFSAACPSQINELVCHSCYSGGSCNT